MFNHYTLEKGKYHILQKIFFMKIWMGFADLMMLV